MLRFVFITLTTLVVFSPAYGLERQQSCYQQLDLETPQGNVAKGLYVFIDQTMPLSATMRDNLNEIVSGHPQAGEQVRIARFSANTRGQYTELLYEGVRDSKPSEAYLYHLRDDTRQQLLDCLAAQKKNVMEGFMGSFQHGLSLIDTRLPKSEIFNGLKRLSETVLIDDELTDKTVLIISDGMENSELVSLYRRHTVSNRLDSAKVLAKLNDHGLVANWRNAKIYMYGLGNIRDERQHVQPSQLAPLLTLWENYFRAGNGIVRDIGTPAILSSKIQQ